MKAKPVQPPHPDEIELLSQIIQELNRRFGTEFSDDDKVFIQHLEEKLAGDPALEATVRVNPPENARLTLTMLRTTRFRS